MGLVVGVLAVGKIGGDEEYLVAGRKLADVGLEGAADGTGGVREGDREGV